MKNKLCYLNKNGLYNQLMTLFKKEFLKDKDYEL